MIHIDGVIVVEGKNDVFRLKKLVDSEFFITNGLDLSKDKLDTLETISKYKDIIIFTDPDSPGNRIRNQISERIPNAKQVFINKKDAIGKNKVGVEHAKDEVIKEALENIITNSTKVNKISFNDYIDLGLMGNRDSKEKREILSKKLHIGLGNSKTFYKWLKMIDITKEEIERLLNE